MDSLQLFICFTVIVFLAVWGCIYMVMIPVVEWVLSVWFTRMTEAWFKVVLIFWAVVCLLGCYLSFFLTWGHLL